MRRLVIAFILLLMMSTVSLAQDLPDSIMNWCDIDGPFAGQCTIEGDEALTNYLWELGWYLAAVDRGEITVSDIPDHYLTQVVEEEDDDSEEDDTSSPYSCDSINLPNVSDNAVSVTGEVEYKDNNYNTTTIDSTTYQTFVAGQEYDPSIIGNKYKVKIKSKDVDGNDVDDYTFKFKCVGKFDDTAGGILP